MKLFIFSDYQLPVIACIFLFFATIFYWISLYFSKKDLFFETGKTLIVLSNLLFGSTLIIRWIQEGYFPLSNLYESLIFLSWSFSFLHLIFEYQTKSRLIGGFSAPILFFLSGFSTLTLPIEMQKASPLVPSLQSNWLMMHVSLMMVSYAVLLLGSLFCILYLTFSYLISDSVSNAVFSKFDQKRNPNLSTIPGQSLTLPTSLNSSSLIPELNPNALKPESTTFSKKLLLETIDIWSYRTIGLGFPLLTIGILSGAIWANEAWGAYWSWDPKETWAFITWIIFAVYLHSRLLKKWEGQRAASLGTVGFFVIWICYLGVNFLGKGLHSYGWVF